jgi:hypothetical protein
MVTTSFRLFSLSLLATLWGVQPVLAQTSYPCVNDVPNCCEVRIPFHTQGRCDFLAGRRGVDNCVKLRLWRRIDMFDMAFADQTGTENGKLNGELHDDPLHFAFRRIASITTKSLR